MIRGIRGATTVHRNESEEIISHTREVIKEMVEVNGIEPEDIASVFISMTSDLNAAFPAKALRQLSGWTYVPVMCMKEVEVEGSLEKCIRVMMNVNTEKTQKEINHIYHHEAKRLRPDLVSKEGIDK